MAADLRFGYRFPAIRGVQSGREYFASMCPLRLIPKIFLFDEEEAELSAELRAQRTLNRNRVPEIATYIVENKGNYVFSALTASIDGEVQFEPVGSDESSMVGMLHVSMSSRFIINDGQHRRAAIEEALKRVPTLGDESIAIVFFVDQGLNRCQQMFADLNRHGVKPSRSIGVLYDHRDELAVLVRQVAIESEFFKGMVEMEKTNLSPRSRRLFTLSALYQATKDLLEGLGLGATETVISTAISYWEAVADAIPEWRHVREGKMTSGEVRRDFIHSHGIALHALGRVGNQLLRDKKSDWKPVIAKLKKLDWSRSNTKLWEGRALSGGHVSKAGQNLVLTTAAIKKFLRMELTPEESKADRAFKAGH